MTFIVLLISFYAHDQVMNRDRSKIPSYTTIDVAKLDHIISLFDSVCDRVLLI